MDSKQHIWLSVMHTTVNARCGMRAQWWWWGMWEDARIHMAGAPVGEASWLLGGDTLLSGSPLIKAGVVRQHLLWEPLTYLPFNGA